MTTQDWQLFEELTREQAAAAAIESTLPARHNSVPLRGEQLLDAEARALRMRIVRSKAGARASSLRWADYESQRTEHFCNEHEHCCNDGQCESDFFMPGVRVQDPYTQKYFVTTGDVFVCKFSARVHVCTRDESACGEAMDSISDPGTMVCPISWRSKGSIANDMRGFQKPDYNRMVDDTNDGPDNALTTAASLSVSGTTTSSSSSNNKRRSLRFGKRAKRTKSSNAASSALADKNDNTAVAFRLSEAHRAEAKSVCDGLLFNGLIRKELLQRRCAIDETLPVLVEQCVRRYGHPDVMQLTSALVGVAMEGLASTLRVLDWQRSITPSECSYLCVMALNMFQLMRQPLNGGGGGGGSAAANNKDINLRKMCLSYLYTMRDGLIGLVEIDADTGEQDRRIHTAAEADAIEQTVRDEQQQRQQEEGVDANTLVRYEFVPRHAGLANVLPDQDSLPVIEGFRTEMTSLMKRRRRVDQFFQAVLDEPQPELFCLSRHVIVRPDIFV